ncbi:MAG: ABC transporter permease [Betaproteobacteria bacterium]|nr:ABC transporter permease [Betaproteobacteria bacterium]
MTAKPSVWFQLWMEVKHNRTAQIALLILFILVVCAIAAPWLAHHDPLTLNLETSRFVPPFFVEGGSMHHPFGTDASGRDVFARVLHGGRISLALGFLPVVIGVGLGVPLGLLSGYLGGRVDQILMRINDCLLAFPSILLALILVAFLGQGIVNLMIAVGIAYAPTFARVSRGAALGERNKEYVVGAFAHGASLSRILFKHVLPNTLNSIVVVATMSFASALLESAGLSFLGLGVRPPVPEWGAMLAEGKADFYQAWWTLVFPGAAIFLTVLSLNMLGDALRDALDPRSERRTA